MQILISSTFIKFRVSYGRDQYLRVNDYGIIVKVKPQCIREGKAWYISCRRVRG
jgi:hypothetical protein